jgi:hypothetical protein
MRTVPFEGVEEIPGLERVPPLDTAFLKLTGNCPIIITAPHAGTEDSTPRGAKAFGQRTRNRAAGGNFNNGDDEYTREITFALVRTLAAMNYRPYAVINLVSRKYMDLNRTWDGQHLWVEITASAPTPSFAMPGDETKPDTDFPRVAEFVGSGNSITRTSTTRCGRSANCSTQTPGYSTSMERTWHAISARG